MSSAKSKKTEPKKPVKTVYHGRQRYPEGKVPAELQKTIDTAKSAAKTGDVKGK